MRFFVRPAKAEDLQEIFDLAKQFTLLNLPAKTSVLENMIAKSIDSFAGRLEKKDASYLFVMEDCDTKKVIATSLIIAKHGSEKEPHHCFEVLTREHFSKDIGIGFKHSVLRYKENKDGPTEIGALLVDPSYRNRPERLGKIISLSRFLYIAMHRASFEEEVLCELSPPLTSEGRSEFWEALGRRFTGLPYTEADQLSQTHKEFISSLFPKEDIYICLLDAKARVDIGKVAEPTIPAKLMLEKIGFRYLNEVDPFDGGPHYGANTEDILAIKKTVSGKLSFNDRAQYEKRALVAANTPQGFRASQSQYDDKEGGIQVPSHIKDLLGLVEGQEIFIYPLD